jgi:hypothetical protein
VTLYQKAFRCPRRNLLKTKRIVRVLAGLTPCAVDAVAPATWEAVPVFDYGIHLGMGRSQSGYHSRREQPRLIVWPAFRRNNEAMSMLVSARQHSKVTDAVSSKPQRVVPLDCIYLTAQPNTHHLTAVPLPVE